MNRGVDSEFKSIDRLLGSNCESKGVDASVSHGSDLRSRCGSLRALDLPSLECHRRRSETIARCPLMYWEPLPHDLHRSNPLAHDIAVGELIGAPCAFLEKAEDASYSMARRQGRA